MHQYLKAFIALLLLLFVGKSLFATTSIHKSRLLHLNGQYVRAESSDAGEISLAVYRDISGRDLVLTHSSVIKKPKGQLVSLEIGSWNHGSCFVVMCIKEEGGTYRYDGIAFGSLDDAGNPLLNKGQAGTFFYSKEFYDTIHINALSGDSISITFLATEELEQRQIKIKSGVLLINHCPVIPMPGTLYSLEGKLIFDTFEALKKSGKFDARPVPFIPSSSKK